MQIVANFNTFDLQKAFLTEFAAKINSYNSFVVSKIRPIIFSLIDSSITTSKEYFAMVSGRLFGEFGEPNIRGAIQDIITTIANNIEININPFKMVANGISGSYEVKVLKLDYSDILNIPSVSFVSEGGFDIQWLKWLLLDGDAKVISNYSFVVSSSVLRFSRTGTGIMKKGSGWNVPAVYSGTSGDNWLTRALEKIDEKIVSELHKIVYNL